MGFGWWDLQLKSGKQTTENRIAKRLAGETFLSLADGKNKKEKKANGKRPTAMAQSGICGRVKEENAEKEGQAGSREGTCLRMEVSASPVSAELSHTASLRLCGFFVLGGRGMAAVPLPAVVCGFAVSR